MKSSEQLMIPLEVIVVEINPMSEHIDNSEDLRMQYIIHNVG